jgi:hypothetical protein
MRTLVIIALVVLSVGGAVAGTIGYLIIAFRQDRIARAMAETGLAPMYAVPASHPQTPARATNPCAARGHVIPGWAHNRDVWFCVREGCTYTAAYCHDDDLPYDQEAVAVFDAARKITREAAGGAA